MNLRFAVALATVLFCIWGNAEPGHGIYQSSSATKKTEDVKPKITFTHEIKHNQVKNNITVKDSNQWSSYMQNYAGAELFKRFESLPGVSNFQFLPGEQTINEESTDKSILESSRDSALVFTVDGATPYTLMFKAKEFLKRCKDSTYAGLESDELNTWTFSGFDPASHGRVGACKMESKVTVEGPIAIYGTLPGADPISTRLLLLNQVKLEWTIRTNYTKRDTLIHSSFHVNGVDFPKAFSKVIGWSMGSNFMTDALLENPTHNALVHAGRILKSINEKILRGE